MGVLQIHEVSTHKFKSKDPLPSSNKDIRKNQARVPYAPPPPSPLPSSSPASSCRASSNCPNGAPWDSFPNRLCQSSPLPKVWLLQLSLLVFCPLEQIEIGPLRNRCPSNPRGKFLLKTKKNSTNGSTSFRAFPEPLDRQSTTGVMFLPAKWQIVHLCVARSHLRLRLLCGILFSVSQVIC